MNVIATIVLLVALVALLAIWGWRDKKRKNESLTLDSNSKYLVPGLIVGNLMFIPHILFRNPTFSFPQPKFFASIFDGNSDFYWAIIISLGLTSVFYLGITFLFSTHKENKKTTRKLVGFYLLNLIIAAGFAALNYMILETLGPAWLY